MFGISLFIKCHTFNLSVVLRETPRTPWLSRLIAVKSGIRTSAQVQKPQEGIILFQNYTTQSFPQLLIFCNFLLRIVFTDTVLKYVWQNNIFRHNVW